MHRQRARLRETVKGDTSSRTLDGRYDVAVTLDGAGGNDTLYEGRGDDRRLGSTGNDIVVARNFIDREDLSDDLFGGGAETDTPVFEGNPSPTPKRATGSLAITGPQNRRRHDQAGQERLHGALERDAGGGRAVLRRGRLSACRVLDPSRGTAFAAASSIRIASRRPLRPSGTSLALRVDGVSSLMATPRPLEAGANAPAGVLRGLMTIFRPKVPPRAEPRRLRPWDDGRSVGIHRPNSRLRGRWKRDHQGGR